MPSPYENLPDQQFWRRSVARVEPFRLDPVTATRFAIAPSDRVATAGSCFAQHISRVLRQIGGNYYVADAPPPTLSAQQAEACGYGVFSARTGNIYTTRQLVQVFEEAHGRRCPQERAWLRRDGRYVDPYRPQIEPDGFACVQDVMHSRAEHLGVLRTLFSTADIFVFTLGLTEAWRCRSDGTVFPVAPGAAGGDFDPALHEFVNFTPGEIEADLRTFLTALTVVNPACRVILTVSPVPLIATYETRHVMVSTAYSKAALRVAVEAILRDFLHVDYFPSYEIITGNFNRGTYYEADLRNVTQAGVSHAMRVFLRHYIEGGGAAGATRTTASGRASALADSDNDGWDIICDEEAIDRMRA